MPRIPKILHLIFGMKADFGLKPWSLVHHACLLSAIQRIKPEQVFLHYQYEPTGPWWALSRPYVSVRPVVAPTSIFGNPLDHTAHKADVIRLQILIEYGGIYLDADVFVQKSFDDLLDNSVVMGQEDAGEGIGMANAVILAEPQAPFLTRWSEEYRSFDQGRWNEHSVKLPARLALLYPEEITVLPPKAFFWPTWQPQDLELLFESSTNISLEGVYANHLWESEAWRRLRDMTPRDVRRGKGNFQRWATPLLTDLPNNYAARSLVYKAKRAGGWSWRRFQATLKRKFSLQP